MATHHTTATGRRRPARSIEWAAGDRARIAAASMFHGAGRLPDPRAPSAAREKTAIDLVRSGAAESGRSAALKPSRQSALSMDRAGVEEAAQAAIRSLRARRNPARAEGVQHYFKHAVVALGIDSPTLRQYGLDQVKRLQPSWTLAESVALCDRLLQEPEMEIRGLGILILHGFRKEFGLDLLQPARRWLATRLDNWALVDSFAGMVLTPILERYPTMAATLRQWSRARPLWVRRAALVTLVPFARRGTHLDLAYDLVSQHFPDREDLMHKAAGWLLREAGKTDMPRLKSFLLEHGSSIPRTALRYAIERFSAAERCQLLEATRLPHGFKESGEAPRPTRARGLRARESSPHRPWPRRPA